MEIEELDEKNAKATGLTKSQVQYKRIEGEKRIKHLLVLDKYVEYASTKKIKYISKKLHKKAQYKEIKSVLRQYPFSGKHFKCDVAMYCTLLDDKVFKSFLKENNIDYEIHKILAITKDQLKGLRENKRYLTRTRSLSCQ